MLIPKNFSNDKPKNPMIESTPLPVRSAIRIPFMNEIVVSSRRNSRGGKIRPVSLSGDGLWNGNCTYAGVEGPLGIPELCLMVLQSLEAEELLAVSSVSHYMSRMANDSTLWKQLFRSQFPKISLSHEPKSWKDYYLERSCFQFYSTVDIHVQSLSSSVINLKRLLHPSSNDTDVSYFPRTDGGLTADSFRFLDTDLPDIKFTSNLTIFGFYEEAEEGMLLHGETVQPVSKLALAVSNQYFILLKFEEIECRNRWLKKILTRCESRDVTECPTMSLVLIQGTNEAF